MWQRSPFFNARPALTPHLEEKGKEQVPERKHTPGEEEQPGMIHATTFTRRKRTRRMQSHRLPLQRSETR
jgi:hypothetical protein